MTANFRVTGQRPSSRVTPGGQIIDTVEVSYETLPSMVSGTISIPASQYSAQYVIDQITPRAVELETVQGIGR